MNEILIPAITLDDMNDMIWMNLENIMINKRSHHKRPQIPKCHLYNISEWTNP